MSDAYAEVPYPGLAFPQTHPDRLAVLAVLHGLQPAPSDSARVLEIGCADGMNIVAMAAHLPGLQAVGFDRVDPALGRETAAALALGNVRLEQADLREERAWGEFDYVIAHGVYAWVPDAAREALLALAGRSLAPHGVAFVSYNALPGARLRTMVREIALLHTGEEVTLEERVARARELYGFLAPWAQERPDAYGQVLASELERLRTLPLSVLAHDDLGERYEPVWLRDLVVRASHHGLRYLAEADPAELHDDRRPDGVDAQLDALAGGDRLVWDQYADLLAGRAFRQTLLCRADAPLDERIDPARIARLYATDARGVQPAAPPDLAARWRAFRAGELALSAAPPRAARAAGLRPETSALARLQAARGPEITSLRHDPVRLDDPFGRFLVRLCDGTRERPALVDTLVAGVGTEVAVTGLDATATGGESLRDQIADGLEHNLALLAHLGLLRR